MIVDKKSSDQLSVFMTYLAKECRDGERLPSLINLATELGMSVAALREQLEIARAMGVVEVKPKTGIRRVMYGFRDSVLSSLAYGIEAEPRNFSAFADLRQHIETAYWHEAVMRLTPDDQAHLKSLVLRAFEKLALNPPQNPQVEHRELHLMMYRRLDNIFVTGLLEAYWKEYEAVGLDVFVEMDYLQRVWQYHQKMVDAICAGDYDLGFHVMAEHMDLLNKRPKNSFNQKFE